MGVFFTGGGWFEPQFPYHTAICSGGGGFQPRFPDHRAIGNRCGIFFCGTPPVRLCRAPGTTCPIAIILHYCTAKKPGIATTYYDATSPAPVEKKRLSAPKLPKGGPAKRAANSAAPGTRRGPAIPDSVPQAGRNTPGTPPPPTRPPLASPPNPLHFLDFAIRHLALGCRLRIWIPLRFGMAFRGGGGLLLHSHRCLQNAENGVLSSRGRPESRHV